MRFFASEPVRTLTGQQVGALCVMDHAPRSALAEHERVALRDAAALAGAGYVRVNGARIDAPGRMVHSGDVITVALDRSVRVLKVRGFRERRGPAGSAEDLYDDLT